MDKFLEIVYANQIADESQGDKYEEIFEPFLTELKSLVSEKVYYKLEELFTDCVTDNNRFYAVEGMKLAIGVMNGTYVMKV